MKPRAARIQTQRQQRHRICDGYFPKLRCFPEQRSESTYPCMDLHPLGRFRSEATAERIGQEPLKFLGISKKLTRWRGGVSKAIGERVVQELEKLLEDRQNLYDCPVSGWNWPRNRPGHRLSKFLESYQNRVRLCIREFESAGGQIVKESLNISIVYRKCPQSCGRGRIRRLAPPFWFGLCDLRSADCDTLKSRGPHSDRIGQRSHALPRYCPESMPPFYQTTSRHLWLRISAS